LCVSVTTLFCPVSKPTSTPKRRVPASIGVLREKGNSTRGRHFSGTA
jgi:hypothetical protein